MPVDTILPSRYHDWIEGTISGKGVIGGSTNSQEGITMDITMAIEEEQLHE